MSYQNNILSFDSLLNTERKTGVRDEFRPVVDGCRQVAVNILPRLFEGMFEKLDDSLYELADKAESNLRQSAFFDAMREIRKDRERISVGFRERVLAGYDGFWKPGQATAGWGNVGPSKDSDDEFSLVEEDALEEGLAINGTIARGENRYYRQLFELNQRFAFLLGRSGMDVKDNPFAPAALVSAFYEQICCLALEVQVKIVIYKQFQREVIDSLEPFYNELNLLLVREGVLVKLSQQVKRSPHREGAKPVESAHWGRREGEPRYAQDEDPELQAEFFGTLRQLLSQRRRGHGMVASSTYPALDSADVVQALSQLQQTSIGTQVDTSPLDMGAVDIRTHLLQVMGGAPGRPPERSIGGNDEDAIDVIAMLFEFILEDRSLPDAMKALLSRLQIPMLKAAILDKTFFHRKNHPARRLLNSMAKAAIGWSGDGGRDDGGLYNKMSTIVEKVLTGFDNNVEIFSELNDDFTTYLESENQGSQKTEQRVTQITKGKDQLKAARHRVFEEINSRTFGKEGIPLPVVTLVKEGWRDVMLLVFLRKGPESEEWRTALALLDKLLWSVAPKPDKSQRQALLTETPTLLKGLRAGLNEISFDQHKMAKLFKDLQACHLCCLKGGDPVHVMGSAATGDSEASHQAPNSDAGDVPNRNHQEASSVRDEYFELAENLPIGTWLDVKEANGMTFRAKLSWRSIVSGTCLFVNRKGQKVVEIPVTDFASWLRTGKARQLAEADVPLMDRALTAMMDVLKKTDRNTSVSDTQISDA
ncbi:MAG: DUF1631 domain-containing protein [Gammaproteobacteria bacterium]|nr:DUF1631 domain-containing protein [Gammaproteobacteria bacterium]